ncbi:glycosyltransferase family 2 protein [Thiohalomonas denitrificans]|uniref:Glycosyltransferase, catalytic subunit of cellulose synthase and poly-beta-1,6-N-acetylglucosamine synthase n=1 Tax=Thiohalomonas denitrificans TaxID=415747 RepID=A0A1G5Q216_9GAMM|nr:glycosyltransferase family 2 protein [Thiohalomonas denitrificans]SCZ55925.1 Glycosyltransferase, catalytic subunit of cellulose synthase and poly-beta-1,6-N-acetylglucosamine synthase [Thiohalomonas denitrificans]
METIFWLALAGSLYSYAFYPAILTLLPKRKRVKRNEPQEWPSVALIITAHNEERRISAKLDNCLELDYPSDRLSIIVASDASTDRTDEITHSYSGRGVQVIRAHTREGKENAQLQAIRSTEAPILVFSDVATHIGPGAIKRVAMQLSDPAIGAVSSEDRFVTANGQVAGEGIYVRYEMWLRRLESSVNTLVGLSGSFFAARRSICADWDTGSPSDFNTAMNAVRQGYLAISDPGLLGIYPDIKNENGEYQRKTRTILRGLTALARHAEVLNPYQYGLFSFQIWSHKVMRWLVPWFLVTILFASLNLALGEGSRFFIAVLAVQISLYGLVAVGTVSRQSRKRWWIKIPYYFVQTNLAAAHATVAYLLGQRVITWQPSVR